MNLQNLKSVKKAVFPKLAQNHSHFVWGRAKKFQNNYNYIYLPYWYITTNACSWQTL